MLHTSVEPGGHLDLAFASAEVSYLATKFCAQLTVGQHAKRKRYCTPTLFISLFAIVLESTPISIAMAIGIGSFDWMEFVVTWEVL